MCSAAIPRKQCPLRVFNPNGLTSDSDWLIRPHNTICNYLKGNDKGLLLAVSLCYYCGLRPSEIRRLKVGDIDLKKGVIILDGTETKNKKTRPRS